MITNSIYSEDNKLFAFEIENVYISIKKVAVLLKESDHVSQVRLRRLFSNETSEFHIKFKYLNINYVVSEPYGDSSEFWIGPEEEENFVDICSIKNVFDEYEPQFFVKMVGDIVTLNLKSLLNMK